MDTATGGMLGIKGVYLACPEINESTSIEVSEVELGLMLVGLVPDGREVLVLLDEAK